jgi:hypothetical protein
MNEERDRELEEVEQTKEELWALQSLPLKVCRTLSLKERAAYEKLKESWEANDERLSLSMIADQARHLVPGASDARAKPYVATYVRAVRDMALYSGSIEHAIVSIVENELRMFFRTLSPEQQATVQPIYDRLVAAMSPGQHQRRVVVDTEPPGQGGN